MMQYQPTILNRLKNYTMRTIGAGALALAALIGAGTAYAQDTPRTLKEEREALSASYEKNNDLNIKLLLHGKAHTENSDDSELTGFSGTGKAIFDFGKTGINLYANGFTQAQDFKTTTVDGKGSRISAGVHGYFPFGAFLEGDVGYENRDYTIESKTTDETFDFGNDSPFVNVKFGLTEKKIDDDDFGVGNKHNWILAQYTKHAGKATGDVQDNGFGDDYDASRWKIQARGMIPGTNLSVEMGGSSLDEKLAEFLEQHNKYAQAGLRYHFPESYIEALGLYQNLKSEVAGEPSTDKRLGVQAGVGWRAIDGDSVVLDLGPYAGYLDSIDGTSKGEWFGGLGGTLHLGGNKKK